LRLAAETTSAVAERLYHTTKSGWRFADVDPWSYDLICGKRRIRHEFKTAAMFASDAFRCISAACVGNAQWIPPPEI
jgi:hypothetical protein